MGGPKSSCLKWTTEAFSLLAARKLAKTSASSVIAREAVPAFTIRLTARRTKQFVTEEIQHHRTLNIFIASSRHKGNNRQSQEGFPSDITLRRQPQEISRKHAETRGNMQKREDLRPAQRKASRQTKSLFLLN